MYIKPLRQILKPEETRMITDVEMMQSGLKSVSHVDVVAIRLCVHSSAQRPLVTWQCVETRVDSCGCLLYYKSILGFGKPLNIRLNRIPASV
jgi:hypothetical protein